MELVGCPPAQTTGRQQGPGTAGPSLLSLPAGLPGAQVRLLTGRVCSRGASGSESGCLGPCAWCLPRNCANPGNSCDLRGLRSVCCLPLLEERRGEGHGWSAEDEACDTEALQAPPLSRWGQFPTRACRTLGTPSPTALWSMAI